MEAVWYLHTDRVEPSSRASDIIAVPFVDDFDLFDIRRMQKCGSEKGIDELTVTFKVLNPISATAREGRDGILKCAESCLNVAGVENRDSVFCDCAVVPSQRLDTFC